MSKRIVILTGNSLRHNPRVIKEATALAEAGFMVEVRERGSIQSLKRRLGVDGQLKIPVSLCTI